jgi:hypothetical protein
VSRNSSGGFTAGAINLTGASILGGLNAVSVRATGLSTSQAVSQSIGRAGLESAWGVSSTPGTFLTDDIAGDVVHTAGSRMLFGSSQSTFQVLSSGATVLGNLNALTINSLNADTTKSVSMSIGRAGAEGVLAVSASSSFPFTDAVAGDLSLCNRNTSNSLLLGVGSSTSASGVKITSASTTINGTLSAGTTTITSTDVSPFRVLSGSLTTKSCAVVGRVAGELQLGVVANANDFTTGSATGDVVLRNLNAGSRILLTINAIARLIVSTTGPITPNAFNSYAGTNGGGVAHLRMCIADGTVRWGVGLLGVESGSTTGSDFQIWNYDDGGGFISNPLKVSRTTGLVTCAGGISTPSISGLTSLTTTTLTATGTLYTPEIRSGTTSAVNAPLGLNLVNGQDLTNVGTLYAYSANLYNSTLGYGLITGTGDIQFNNAGHIEFNHRNLTGVKSITLNGAVWGSDPATSVPIYMLSGNSSNYCALNMGRTALELELGVVAVGGQFVSGTLTGDIALKNDNSSNSIFFGCSTIPCLALSVANNTLYSPTTFNSTATFSGAATFNGAVTLNSAINSSNFISDTLVKHATQTITSPCGTTVYTINSSVSRSGYGRINLQITDSGGATHYADLGVAWGWDSVSQVGFSLAHKSPNVTMGSATFSGTFYADQSFTITNVSGSFLLEISYSTTNSISLKPPAVSSLVVRSAIDN